MTDSNDWEKQIDLVYLWCDGQDPVFIAEKNQRLKGLNLPFTEENLGNKRYVEHDELRYSLRSVIAYVPWVRHIYIVTNNQIPNWLKLHPKISIIDHSDIIPGELRPVFSAITIEMYLNKIPNLSEWFLFANDDMFFNRKLEPEDFFTKDGKPIVWLSQPEKMDENRATSILKEQRTDWYKTLVRSWMLYRKKKKVDIPFYTPAHSIDAYKKEYFSQTLEDFPEMKTTNSQPFRTGEEITRIMFSYEMINAFSCPFILKKKANFLERMIARLNPSLDYVSVARENIVKLKRDISVFNPKTFCLNAISDKDVELTRQYFQERWPEPAPWEKI